MDTFQEHQEWDNAATSLRIWVRLLIISGIGLIGFVGGCVAAWRIIFGVPSGEPEKQLVSYILLACIGIVIGAIVTLASVVWNAFVYRE